MLIRKKLNCAFNDCNLYDLSVLIMLTCRIYHCVQILMLIRGNAHLVHLAFVMQAPPVLRLHLTCAPAAVLRKRIN